MNLTVFKIFSVLFLSIFCSSAMACLTTPLEIRTHVDELIERTDNIVLVQVKSASTTNHFGYRELVKEMPKEIQHLILVDLFKRFIEFPYIEYTFSVLKTMKGSVDQEFKMMGYTLQQGDLTTFNDHTDKPIHESRGRFFTEMDCTIHPSFNVGGVYLLFLDKPYHVLGMEKIENLGEDKWFEYVEQELEQ